AIVCNRQAAILKPLDDESCPSITADRFASSAATKAQGGHGDLLLSGMGAQPKYEGKMIQRQEGPGVPLILLRIHSGPLFSSEVVFGVAPEPIQNRRARPRSVSAGHVEIG